MDFTRRLLALALVLLPAMAATAAPPDATARHLDATLPVETRVHSLLSRMTLEEKCEQLRADSLARLQVFDGTVSPESLERVFKDRMPGVILMDPGADIRTNTIKARDLTAHVREKSRLGIPPLLLTTGARGIVAQGATLFPSTLALGATWDPALVREMAARLASEASATGATQLLGPSFALGRDPRFGGIEHCFGECPAHTAELGLAFLEGLQGRNAATGLAPNKVFGTALHFTAWATPDGGLYGAPVSLSTHTLRSLHLPPFDEAVRKGQVQAVMPVLSAVNSVPGHANAWLLDTVLRQEWQFAGYVLGAPGGVAMNHTIFAVAEDRRAAAIQALTAGVDLDLPSPSGDTYAELPQLVHRGIIPGDDIDKAAARILRLKFLAGLFDSRRIMDPSLLPTRIRTADTRALVRRLATESLVLLKNTDNFLPLDTERIKTLAVIGPNADRSQFGDATWSNNDDDGITVLRGLRNLLGSKIRITHTQGCALSGNSRAGFEEAIAVAKGSDAVLLVLGDESPPPPTARPDATTPRTPTSGEGYDVSNPILPGIQEELARAIIATGRPTIVLFLHGRPFSTPWIKDNATAILSLFYAGEEQGHAVADILFGNADPGGRLPVSIARNAGTIPTTYDYKPGARGIFHRPGTPARAGRDYVFNSAAPLWPFGHGLSYTRFQYSDMVVETPSITSDGIVRVRFTVTNIGNRDGTDVAQIYFHKTASSVTVPALRLARFRKIRLKAGESTRVLMAFDATTMSEWDRLVRRRVVEPGEYEIFVGTSAEDILLRSQVWVR
ncbi:MAG: glycoside hydrolase family 3 C-terminal domain-containing protein [Puniceicoccales bacterium]|jgi:beta-glucosidase|nr:glycoside hydrolase family 3 C-terminal domain-containing protein [Puniceicoccales bacterium]